MLKTQKKNYKKVRNNMRKNFSGIFKKDKHVRTLTFFT